MRVWIAAIVAGTTGCSASLFDRVDCDSNTACQAAFGYGSICVEDGYCETMALPERCSLDIGDEPGDWPLPQAPDDGSQGYFLISTLFDDAPVHQARRNSVDLAVAEVNKGQGLAGRDFAALHCLYDDRSDEQDGIGSEAAVQELGEILQNDFGIPVNVGPAGSSLSRALYDTLTTAAEGDQPEMLSISPASTAIELTTIDGSSPSDEAPGMFWRTVPDDEVQAMAIVSDLVNEFDASGVTNARLAPSLNVAIVYERGAYGNGLTQVLIPGMDAEGGTATPFPWDSSETLANQVVTVANSTPSFDEIVFISSTADDYRRFLSAVDQQAPLDSTPLFFTDGGLTVDAIAGFESNAAVLDRLRMSAPGVPSGTEFSVFAALYQGEYGEDPNNYVFTSHSWDAAWLAFYGHAYAEAERAGLYEGINLSRGLRQVSDGTPIAVGQSGWQPGLNAMRDSGELDLMGASGSLDFAESTGELTGGIQIFGVEEGGGGFVPLYDFPR